MTSENATKKCVVLLSGGIDSSVLMYSLIEKYEVWPITISYGQRHVKEIMAARNVCEARGSWLLKRWRYVDLSILGTLLPSSLTGVGNVPEGRYDDVVMRSTVVPNRNMILLAIATGYAGGIGAKYVAYAPHQGDHPIYADCRVEFIRAMQEAIYLGNGIELLTPFSILTKAAVVKIGMGLTVPFKLTWSCYNGEDRPCLKCGTDVERTEAFLSSNSVDPALTPAEWEEAVRYLKGVSLSDVR